MRLLLDAMMDRDLTDALSRMGHEAGHVEVLLGIRKPDQEIFDFLEAENFDALITRDHFADGEDRMAALYAMAAGARVAQVNLREGLDTGPLQIAAVILHLSDIQALIRTDSFIRRIHVGAEAGVQRSDTLYDILNEIHRLGGGD